MPPQTAPRPVAVQIGAGNIGRGFMGELFSAGGYRTVFADVDRAVVDALNARGGYEIHHVTNDGDHVVAVRDASAVDARDTEALAEAIAGAHLVCTAVGVRVLEAVAPVLAQGIARRLARSGSPLNVITCENLVGAGRFLRDLVWARLELLVGRGKVPVAGRAEFEARFGFVEAVVSRMVPIVPADTRRRDPLWIACEPYARLPVDGAALRGPPLRVPGMEPVGNILAYQRRKLASHNMSHAVCAYLGYRAGHEFIWQAVGDRGVLAEVQAAMAETGRALVSRFGFAPSEQQAYEQDLIERYRNRALGDQVRRVAADPLRKLGPQDRLTGSARLCLEEGIAPTHVVRGIEAALSYDHPDDPGATKLQEMLRSGGRERILREVCGLSPDEPLYGLLRDAPRGGNGG